VDLLFREGDVGKAHVVVVDDESDTRRLVRIALERNGMLVDEATTGEELLGRVLEERYDVIILDVMMPKLSGYDVCRRLKSDERTRNVPVIFLSAKGQLSEVDEGLEVGGIVYIVKPFSIKHLVAQVQAVLAETQKTSLSVAQEGNAQ
jgi:DNA-binding response OmpR family regulator